MSLHPVRLEIYGKDIVIFVATIARTPTRMERLPRCSNDSQKRRVIALLLRLGTSVPCRWLAWFRVVLS